MSWRRTTSSSSACDIGVRGRVICLVSVAMADHDLPGALKIALSRKRGEITQQKNARFERSGAASGGLVERRAETIEPRADPGDRFFLGDRPGAGIVQHDVADALGAERLQQRVEAIAAEAEGLGIGAVAECDHAIDDAAEVRLLLLEFGKELLGVV